MWQNDLRVLHWFAMRSMDSLNGEITMGISYYCYVKLLWNIIDSACMIHCRYWVCLLGSVIEETAKPALGSPPNE